MKKKLTIGLFGFGTVGQGLYNVLTQTKGVKAEIKRIAIKDNTKHRSLPSPLFTTDKHDLLLDPTIDIIVELINDHKAAFEIVKAAVQNGKHVITANKRMLAENLEEIFSLQQQYGKSILYEGSVCGSIPIIRNLEEYYDNDLLTSIEGIFNGSTNYILTKVFDEKKTYADALQQAQVLGFAETNPALDVEGYDPKFKLVIAIAHTFGVFVKPEHVINIGIDKLSATDLKYARENNLAIKLIARAFRIDDTVFGFVAPQFIEQHHPLAAIRNEYNAVQVEGAFAEKQLFVGKGAGSFPTASAVLSDVSALTYGYAYEYKKRAQQNQLAFSNEVVVEALVSFEKGTDISINDFEKFTAGYAANGKQFLSGLVSLTQLKEWSDQPGVSVVLAPNAAFSTKIEHREVEALAR
jgi:homoserine dehydrogenase